MPFHLQALGYSDLSVLVGYLLFAYVRIDHCIHSFELINGFRLSF